MKNKTIKEVIIVEGRNDTAAIKRAVNTDTIETHGFGIKKITWQLIENAANMRGIIIFTDPDFSGNEIRKKVKARFPGAKEAFLSVKEAERNGDIGIENASPEAISKALEKARCTKEEVYNEFIQRDLVEGGLTDKNNASQRRSALGEILGIGYGNASAFLTKLNKYGITREEYNEALRKINDK
ncbi:MAG: ribonuclease M5 [Eubacteriales bacterium]|nr:ribonuclease M5 [Eubacteriales bacterium]MDD4389360.1 ribonuclease M5 [Eubacteriales bacterium]